MSHPDELLDVGSGNRNVIYQTSLIASNPTFERQEGKEKSEHT